MVETMFLLAILLFSTLYLFGSTLLSMPPLDVVRGLMGVIRGDDGQKSTIADAIADAMKYNSINSHIQIKHPSF